MTTMPPTSFTPTTIAPTPAPTTAPPYRPEENTFFDCNLEDDNDKPIGRLSFNFSISGECIDNHIDAGTLSFAFSIDGDGIKGNVISPDKLEFNFEFQTHGADDHSAYVHAGVPRGSFAQWSKIGYLDFTIDHSNEAGEAYLKELGNIYGVCKLGSSVVLYGSSGIGLMAPSDVAWGYKNLSDKGVISRDAHTGDDKVQWYIDVDGDLNEVTDHVTRLGYKEFLSTLTNPIMLVDERRFLLYICDGSTGYVFSYNDKSLGEGYTNLTGFGYTISEELVCSFVSTATTFAPTTYLTSLAPSTSIATLAPTTAIPEILIKTDTFDFGTRKEKTLYGIQVSTDLDVDLQVAIEYRLTMDGAFLSTPWINVNPLGMTYLPCFGIEFRIKLRTLSAADFEVDQLTITGIVHGADKTDYIGGFYD